MRCCYYSSSFIYNFSVSAVIHLLNKLNKYTRTYICIYLQTHNMNIYIFILLALFKTKYFVLFKYIIYMCVCGYNAFSFNQNNCGYANNFLLPH